MTVAALVRGPEKTYNALVVDAGVGQHGPDVTYECAHDKIRLAFGNTYVTAVGDALLLDALASMIAWSDPKRPDLRRPETFHALVGGVERLRRIQVANGQPVAQEPGGAHLLVCTRHDAWCWRAAYDGSTGTFERPTKSIELESGKGIVLWGGNTLVPVDVPEAGPSDSFEPIVDLLFQVNAAVGAMGFTLPYALGRRCSGVILPHSTKAELRRQRPFDSLPEQWVKYRGGPAMALLADAAFMDFPTVPAT